MSIINYLPKKHHRVKIIGGDYNIEKMFKERDYEIVQDEPDLVCFTGGEDVSPHYYGEKPLPMTHYNLERDRREVAAYNRYVNTPKVGICRGGQFLNVMSGGSMWQHVDGHGGSHKMQDLLIYKTDLVMTSTHHQMMRPTIEGEIIGIAHESKVFISADKDMKKPEHDIEVVYYEHTKSLCFQPHPENGYCSKDSECNVYFFELVNMLL